MASNAIDEIREFFRGQMELNVPMDTMTTIRTGGPADLVLRPEDKQDLSEVLKFLNDRSIAARAIGSGSTVVVRDGGIRGAIISLTDGFRDILPAPDWAGTPQIRAGAGVMISDLTEWAVEHGFGGLEFLAGIPGTLGGAVVNNSFGWGRAVSDVFVEAEVMDSFGNIHTLRHEALGFGDRRSNLPEGFIILSATLKGEHRDSSQIDTMSRNFLSRRRSNYPLGEDCVGMVFRNAGGQPAERLIDACGLKGVRVGDAEVSRLNPNFIVSLGNVEAGNVVSLIGMIQERVYVKYKLKLEITLTVLGNWQKSKVRIRE